MASCTVNYNLKDAGYANFANQTLTFTLLTAGAEGSGDYVVAASSVTSTSDANGDGSVTLFVNDDSGIKSIYDVTLPNAEHIQFIIPTGTSTIELANLIVNNQPAGDAETQQSTVYAQAIQRANHTGTQTLSTISDAGTIASQDSNSVSITGGSLTDVSVDLNGRELILDADADTSITSDADDRIDIKVAGTDQIQFTDGAILPVTDNDVDLGSALKGFKNLHADGSTILGTINANTVTASSGGFSSVTSTTADIDGGTIDGGTIGTNSVATDVRVDNLKLDGNAITSTDTDGNIDLTPDGTGEVNISKVDIDGGAIDGTTIGGSTAAAVTGTDVLATDSIGYGAGNGGTVTQTTSITTAVTLNAICGVITCVSNDYSSNQVDSFTLNNTFIDATDIIIISFQDGHPNLTVGASDVANNSCQITIKNGTNSAANGVTCKLNFAVIKIATS